MAIAITWNLYFFSWLSPTFEHGTPMVILILGDASGQSRWGQGIRPEWRWYLAAETIPKAERLVVCFFGGVVQLIQTSKSNLIYESILILRWHVKHPWWQGIYNRARLGPKRMENQVRMNDHWKFSMLWIGSWLVAIPMGITLGKIGSFKRSIRNWVL